MFGRVLNTSLEIVAKISDKREENANLALATPSEYLT